MTEAVAVAARKPASPGRPVRARMSRDDIIMRGAMLLLGLLLVSLLELFVSSLALLEMRTTSF